METKVAVMEADIKNLGSRFKDHLDDVRALRGTWTVVTVTIVGFILFILGVIATGFYWVSDKQISLIEGQVVNKRDMNDIKDQLVKINASINEITKEHTSFKR